MGTLDSKLEPEDLDTLLEAMEGWESNNNHEFHVMNAVKSIPVPPEGDEAYEPVRMIKEHYRKREKEIKDNRSIRQEKAVFLKAKLMLIKQDGGIAQLYAEATKPVAQTGVSSDKADLHAAESFIDDLKVWKFYDKFRTDRGMEPRVFKKD